MRLNIHQHIWLDLEQESMVAAALIALHADDVHQVV